MAAEEAHAAPADPRSTDAVSRFGLPFPIAALYHRMVVQYEPSARFGFALRLAEGVFRFLALVALADAVSFAGTERRPRATPKDVTRWLEMLAAPGMGKYLAVLRSTTTACLRDAPFVPELGRLAGGDPPGATEWHGAASRIVELRNRWTHDEVQVTNAEARPLLAAIEDPLREVLTGIQFLARYRLGHAHQLRALANGSFGWVWVGSRGLEELCEAVELRSRGAVPQDTALLLAPDRELALSLAPWLYWGLSDNDTAWHLFWLHSLVTDGGARRARYLHPALRKQEVVRDFPHPDDAQGPGVAVDAYPARRDEWPGRIALGLDARSKAALSDPTEPPTLGERFRVVGKLGEGGMGVVYEVEDSLLDRRCALKVLNAQHARSPAALKRFQREAKILAGLDHPGIVRVHDVGFADGAPFILMEVVRGVTLDERIRAEGPLSLDEAVRVIAELLDALAAVHDAKVVHRDVKPANVALCEDGVRLLDLGIALAEGKSRLTSAADRMGTLGFMAPEQLAGRAGAASDLYAVGQLLFALLTGRAPQPQPGDPEDERMIEAWPAPIARAYRRATAADPRARHAHARALRDDLLAAAELATAVGIPVADPVPRDAPTRTLDELVSRVAEWPSPVAAVLATLPPFDGAERALRPQPGRLAGIWAVVAMPLDDGIFRALEICLGYLLATTVARGGMRAPGTRETVVVDFLERPSTLAVQLAVVHKGLRALAGHTGVRQFGDPGSFLAIAQRLIRIRNEIAHSGAAAAHAQLASLIGAFALFLERLAPLASDEVYVGPIVGAPGGHALARGPLPALLRPTRIPAAPPGVSLKVGEHHVSLEPFVRCGGLPWDLRVLVGRRRSGTLVYRGAFGDESVDDADVHAAVRRALRGEDPALPP